MSRSHTGSKGFCFEYWSKRNIPKVGYFPVGKKAKTLTCRSERRQAHALVRDEVLDLETRESLDWALEVWWHEEAWDAYYEEEYENDGVW